jgi:hypothetical protein
LMGTQIDNSWLAACQVYSSGDDRPSSKKKG